MAFPPFTGDLRDDKAWNGYLAEHLTSEQIEILNQGWERSLARLFVVLQKPYPRQITDGAKRDWIRVVLAVEVDLKPAGRAVLRLPPVRLPDAPDGKAVHQPAGYYVEIYWVKTSRAKRGTEPPQQPKSIRIIGEPFVTVGMQPDLDLCWTAFFVALSGAAVPAAFRRAPRARPAPGQEPDLDFYGQLIAAEKALIAAGSRHPAKDLAKRYPDVEYATVRAWLSRGKKYLEEDKS